MKLLGCTVRHTEVPDDGRLVFRDYSAKVLAAAKSGMQGSKVLEHPSIPERSAVTFFTDAHTMRRLRRYLTSTQQAGALLR